MPIFAVVKQNFVPTGSRCDCIVWPTARQRHYSNFTFFQKKQRLNSSIMKKQLTALCMMLAAITATPLTSCSIDDNSPIVNSIVNTIVADNAPAQQSNNKGNGGVLTISVPVTDQTLVATDMTVTITDQNGVATNVEVKASDLKTAAQAGEMASRSKAKEAYQLGIDVDKVKKGHAELMYFEYNIAIGATPAQYTVAVNYSHKSGDVGVRTIDFLLCSPYAAFTPNGGEAIYADAEATNFDGQAYMGMSVSEDHFDDFKAVLGGFGSFARTISVDKGGVITMR